MLNPMLHTFGHGKLDNKEANTFCIDDEVAALVEALQEAAQ